MNDQMYKYFELLSGRFEGFRNELISLRSSETTELSTFKVVEEVTDSAIHAPDYIEAIEYFKNEKEIIFCCKLNSVLRKVQREAKYYTSYKQTSIYEYYAKGIENKKATFEFLSFPTEEKH